MAPDVSGIVRVGDPVLARLSPPETEFDAGLQLIARDVVEATWKPGRLAVAAPQLGVNRRLFAIHYAARVITMVNPEVVWHRGTEEYRESCLSIPGFSWPLMRPKTIRVVYRTPKGEERDLEADGLTARGIQHEVDHLDGILLPDRIREAWPTMTRQVRRQASRTLAKYGVLLAA